MHGLLVVGASGKWFTPASPSSAGHCKLPTPPQTVEFRTYLYNKETNSQPFPSLMPPLTEADTCRTYVVPKLYAAGWSDDQISEQKSFTDGRIIVAGDKPRRRPQKRADWCLVAIHKSR